MKILWLPSWYPSAINPLNGDFVQRHAQAASLYNDIDVLFLEKDISGSVTKSELVQEKQTARLTERIVYYHASPKTNLLGKVFAITRYQQVYRREIRRYIKRNGKPDLVHVHVAMKAGLIARWIKKKYKIPYVLTEHWTGYLTEAPENINTHSLFYRLATRNIFKNASGLTVVSNYLGNAIKNFYSTLNYLVIPNVVNTEIFYPVVKSSEVLRFIHISTLNHQKNAEAILDAFSQIKTKVSNFQVDIIGPKNDSLLQLTESLGLSNVINFFSEVPQTELAKYLQLSHALILYSRYETFGCVIIEANACGIPVLVSDLEVFKETVTVGFNGITASADNPTKLAEKILWFIENRQKFDANKISEATSKKYSYEVVGQQFDDWYHSFI